jgi:uncharacterized repeat protein (TIGR01451 family)
MKNIDHKLSNSFLQNYLKTVILVLVSLFIQQLEAQNYTFPQDTISNIAWEQLPGPPISVNAYAYSNGISWAATNNGLFSSADNGQNWHFNTAFGLKPVNDVRCGNGWVLAISYRFVSYDPPYSSNAFYDFWYSSNNGGSWQKTTEYYAGVFHFGRYIIKNISQKNDSTLVFASGTTIPNDLNPQISTNKGLTWTKKLIDVAAIGAKNDTIFGYSGTSATDRRVFICSKNDFSDTTWLNLPSPIAPEPSWTPDAIAYENGKFLRFYNNSPNPLLYIGSFAAGTWAEQVLPFGTNVTIENLQNRNGYYYLFVKTSNFFTKSGIYRAHINDLSNWETIIEKENTPNEYPVSYDLVDSLGIFYQDIVGNTFYSEDNGLTWNKRNSGLSGSQITDVEFWCDAPQAQVSNSRWYGANSQGGDWEATNLRPFTNNNPDVSDYLGENNGILWGFNGAGIIRSEDCGNNWDTLTNFPINTQSIKMTTDQTRTLLWSKQINQLYITNDNGQSWQTINTPGNFIVGVVLRGDTILVIREYNSSLVKLVLEKSYDGGLTWDPWMYRFPNNITKYYEKNGTFYVVEPSTTLRFYESKDFAETWSNSVPVYDYYLIGPSIPPHVKTFQDGIYFIHADRGLHISKDGGKNWTFIENLPFVNESTPNASQIGVPIVTYQLQGALNYYVNNGYLYAATLRQGLWRTSWQPILDALAANDGARGEIFGRLYIEENGNCKYDTSETVLPYTPVRILPIDKVILTDVQGKYSFSVDTGKYYRIETMLPHLHKSLCDSTIRDSIYVKNTTPKQDFGFTPILNAIDWEITMTGFSPIRPGFETNGRVFVKNRGNINSSAEQLTFEYPIDWIALQSVVPNALSPTLGTLLFDVPILEVGETWEAEITLKANTILPLGTNVILKANSNLSNDVFTSNNQAVLNRIVTGSFDPNEKNVQQTTILPAESQWLDYEIHFQNTGTDTAFRVILIDTLDENLDLLTFQSLESSHTYKVEINESKVIRWTFQNINLPDSTTNLLGSQGWVHFRIKTRNGLQNNEILNNKANIFFDFNNPITTNTVTTSVQKGIIHQNITINLCEGALYNGQMWPNGGTKIDTFQTLTHDTIRMTHIVPHETYSVQETQVIVAGTIVFGTPIFQDTVLVFSLQSVWGCDSIYTLTLQTIVGENPIYNQIKDLQFFPNPVEDWLFIKSNMLPLGDYKLLFFNGLGQKVKSVLVSKKDLKTMTIDVGDLNIGVYFIRLEGILGGGILIKK